MTTTDLSGRVAVVTGASSGIGGAVVQALHGGGAKVAAFARRAERLMALGESMGAKDRYLAVEVDLRDVAATRSAFGKVREHWGGTDILVNNAGLGHAAPLTEGNDEAWREMLEVNILGLCVCTHEAVADMRRREVAGHVVHISSMAAHRVPPNSGVYSASKYAVRSLTEGLRKELRELGSDIRVSAVSPGYVDTEFHEKYHRDPAAGDRVKADFDVLTSEDVAEGVMYVLAQPAHVQVHDVLMRPTRQPL